MNTRIQVEHPVTELVTGIDLVQWQLRVAGGERLPFTQSDIRWQGHAIECRITSEDPRNNFMPLTGRIEALVLPSGPGIRWDGGIEFGSEVSLYYDPMLAKLIVHAPSRELAIARMRRALDQLTIIGVETSVPFHRQVMQEPDFIAGRLSINYLDQHRELVSGSRAADARQRAALAAALLEEEKSQRRGTSRTQLPAAAANAWREPPRANPSGGWRGDRSWPS